MLILSGNPIFNSINQPLTLLNNVSYFSADDGVHGIELWRSNGTATGTYLVKDITAGSGSTYLSNIITSNNQVYFTVYNSNSGRYELWKSDGTDIGTMVVTVFTLSYYYTPSNFCDVNGILYFTYSHDNKNDQLWKSNGTGAGTVIVKDFESERGYNLRNLISANGLLQFIAYTPAYGNEVWRSDGSGSGTYLLKDINPNSSDLNNFGPSQLTAYDKRLYFAESDNFNSELWVSDGTPQGTFIAPGYNYIGVGAYNAPGSFNNPNINVPFIISNNVLYFPGYTNQTGVELYKYNAANSAAGIQLVKDIVPGSLSTFFDANSIADVNNIIYFSCTGLGNFRLYKTNGTDASTVNVKIFDSSVFTSAFFNGNGKLYFTAFDPNYGYEPLVSDGTSLGTVLLSDIYPGSVNSYPGYFTTCNNKVLFAATSDKYGSELFLSTDNGAQIVKEINSTTTSGSFPSTMAAFSNGVITRAYTYDKGYELWTGNSLDENFVKDIVKGQNGSSPHFFTVKGDTAYFVADTFSYPFYPYSNIYRTDGTTAGTIKVTSDIKGYIYGYTIMDDGTIFYVVNNYKISAPYELWKTDGTAAGTVLLHTFSLMTTGYDSKRGNFTNLFPIGNTVYLSASDADTSTGSELWKSDGTVNGTLLVKDILPGYYANSEPNYLTVFNKQLFFSAYDGSETALWKSDGSEAGTVKVKSVRPYEFEIFNKTLLFNGYTSDIAGELWKTDGTSEGTTLVKDINRGAGSSFPLSLTDVNGTLFFSASDSTNFAQLWKTDGTTAGTQLVKNIFPNANSRYLSSFVGAANKLFFIANNQLWASDGSSNGTGIIMDEVLNGLLISDVVSNSNQLFLNAYNYKYGYELYTGIANQIVLPVNLLSFTASLQNTGVLIQWQTATEVNTAFYTVQRSTDGTHFTDAGKIMATGSSNGLQQYSFNDANIANLVTAKTLYYRLLITDKDGSTSYSKVVPIDLKWKDITVLLHPNPAKEVLTVRINNYTGAAAIDLYDLSGKKLRSTRASVEASSNVTINITALPAGVYMVKMNIGGKMIQQKFVKQ